MKDETISVTVKWQNSNPLPQQTIKKVIKKYTYIKGTNQKVITSYELRT